MTGTGIHMQVGIGGAPEGVLCAAAMKCLGGEILARLRPRSDAERARCIRMGVSDPDQVLSTNDLAPGEHIVFLASGVTRGDLLDGVRFFGTGVRVSSLTMNYIGHRIRFIDSVYLLQRGSVPISRN
jgi:fructose-1,6-bisphosphatase II